MTIACLLRRITQSAFRVLIILSLMASSGCGQKGALYLPEEKAQPTLSSTEQNQNTPDKKDKQPKN
ncbi:LPS translocon maturation chaperone LptM [Litoribrevibacter albus]|uniref:Lipoprotein n=1 Tax=Litoribrevibacter albus TaxID=1473156 RepID=A0AA37W7S4_9GAMM|nr:lipoprotein [Litoribrevibacter albus]GLQ33055.1 hypothetical protein GCM10007876_35340 [Litoribrevibacter albus]